MSNRNNQIRNKIIQSLPKTDDAKIGGLERFLHKKFPRCVTMLEPYMKFTKGEDEYIGFADSLTSWDVLKYKILHPDVIMILNNKMMVLELDGEIHDIKVEKTQMRNQLYESNKIDYVVVNEAELKMELGVTKSALLSQDQINEAFLKKINSKF